jgi:hypothetical protein
MRPYAAVCGTTEMMDPYGVKTGFADEDLQ